MNEYSIDELINVLDLGAEIDFKINNEKYSISQTEGKIILTKHRDCENYQTFDSTIDLVKNGIIENEPLELKWEHVIVTMWF